MKKIFRIDNLKYLVAFLIPLVFVMIVVRWLDNDSWFVLAEGRYLVQNGIHFTDVLSMHSDFSIVVQNYGFAIVFYLIHEWFSAAGLYITMLIMNGVICYLVYKICILLSKKNVNLSLLIMVITDVLLVICSFVTTRAQMVSYIVFLSLIYVLELYIKTGKMKHLWWIPLLSLIEINMHASMWWMIFLVMLAYIVGAVKIPKFHQRGYKIRPLLLVGGISLLVGLINPYGIKMITYIFTSYGDSAISSLVNEMHPFTLWNVCNVLLYFGIVLVLVLYMFAKKRNIMLRFLLLFFGFFALGISSYRGMSHLILSMFLPIALMYKDVKIEKIFDSKFVRNAMIVWSGAMVVVIAFTLFFIVPGSIPDGPRASLVSAVDFIDDIVSDEMQEDQLKVFAGYDDGGYLEYRGYKPYIDPRAEVFLKKNNNKDDVMAEYVDIITGNADFDAFIKKYDFDYMVIGPVDRMIYRMGIDYDEGKNLEGRVFHAGENNYRLIYASDEKDVLVYEKE